MAWVVHINGWPGSGKRTIGRVLAGMTGARLLDNHVMLNPAEALFERGDPLNASLRRLVRDATLDHAARMAAEVPLIVTEALADDPSDAALFAEVRVLAERRGVRFLSVVLEIAAAENERRLTMPGRAESLKLTRPEVLRHLRARYALLRGAGDDVVMLDVTALSPEAAAGTIAVRVMR